MNWVRKYNQSTYILIVINIDATIHSRNSLYAASY